MHTTENASHARNTQYVSHLCTLVLFSTSSSVKLRAWDCLQQLLLKQPVLCLWAARVHCHPFSIVHFLLCISLIGTPGIT